MSIEEIRIFPMSNKDPDSATLGKLESYLSDKLPNNQEGKYYYPSKPGMTYKINTEVLVLFQYQGTIRGCGILTDLVEDDGKIEFDKEYNGYFQFEPSSLKYFKKPIKKEEIALISDKFKRFGQAKQTIEIENLDKILDLIEKHSKMEL